MFIKQLSCPGSARESWPQGLLTVGVLECLGCVFYSLLAFLSPSLNNPASIQALQGEAPGPGSSHTPSPLGWPGSLPEV